MRRARIQVKPNLAARKSGGKTNTSSTKPDGPDIKEENKITDDGEVNTLRAPHNDLQKTTTPSADQVAADAHETTSNPAINTKISDPEPDVIPSVEKSAESAIIPAVDTEARITNAENTTPKDDSKEAKLKENTGSNIKPTQPSVRRSKIKPMVKVKPRIGAPRNKPEPEKKDELTKHTANEKSSTVVDPSEEKEDQFTQIKPHEPDKTTTRHTPISVTPPAIVTLNGNDKTAGSRENAIVSIIKVTNEPENSDTTSLKDKTTVSIIKKEKLNSSHLVAGKDDVITSVANGLPSSSQTPTITKIVPARRHRMIKPRPNLVDSAQYRKRTSSFSASDTDDEHFKRHVTSPPAHNLTTGHQTSGNHSTATKVEQSDNNDSSTVDPPKSYFKRMADVQRERRRGLTERKCRPRVKLEETVDRSTMRICDMIYANPTQNRMKSTIREEEKLRKAKEEKLARESVVGSPDRASQLDVDDPPGDPDTPRDPEKSRDDLEHESEAVEPEAPSTPAPAPSSEPQDAEPEEANEPVMVPQVTIGADGQIVINESSLTVAQPDQGQSAVYDGEAVEEEGNMPYVPSKYYRRAAKFKPWTWRDRKAGHCLLTVLLSTTAPPNSRPGVVRYVFVKSPGNPGIETKRFYLALSVVGSDFSLMTSLFQGRDRNDLKKKFKREEKVNRWLVDKALQDTKSYDISLFEQLSDTDSEEEKERIKKEKEAKEEEKRQKRVLKKMEKDLEKKQQEKLEKRKREKLEGDPGERKQPKRAKKKKFFYFDVSSGDEAPEEAKSKQTTVKEGDQENDNTQDKTDDTSNKDADFSIQDEIAASESSPKAKPKKTRKRKIKTDGKEKSGDKDRTESEKPAKKKRGRSKKADSEASEKTNVSAIPAHRAQFSPGQLLLVSDDTSTQQGGVGYVKGPDGMIHMYMVDPQPEEGAGTSEQAAGNQSISSASNIARSPRDHRDSINEALAAAMENESNPFSDFITKKLIGSSPPPQPGPIFTPDLTSRTTKQASSSSRKRHHSRNSNSVSMESTNKSSPRTQKEVDEAKLLLDLTYFGRHIDEQQPFEKNVELNFTSTSDVMGPNGPDSPQIVAITKLNENSENQDNIGDSDPGEKRMDTSGHALVDNSTIESPDRNNDSQNVGQSCDILDMSSPASNSRGFLEHLNAPDEISPSAENLRKTKTKALKKISAETNKNTSKSNLKFHMVTFPQPPSTNRVVSKDSLKESNKSSSKKSSFKTAQESNLPNKSSSENVTGSNGGNEMKSPKDNALKQPVVKHGTSLNDSFTAIKEPLSSREIASTVSICLVPEPLIVDAVNSSRGSRSGDLRLDCNLASKIVTTASICLVSPPPAFMAVSRAGSRTTQGHMTAVANDGSIMHITPHSNKTSDSISTSGELPRSSSTSKRNSPSLITARDKDGLVMYINPATGEVVKPPVINSASPLSVSVGHTNTTDSVTSPLSSASQMGDNRLLSPSGLPARFSHLSPTRSKSPASDHARFSHLSPTRSRSPARKDSDNARFSHLSPTRSKSPARRDSDGHFVVKAGSKSPIRSPSRSGSPRVHYVDHASVEDLVTMNKVLAQIPNMLANSGKGSTNSSLKPTTSSVGGTSKSTATAGTSKPFRKRIKPQPNLSRPRAPIASAAMAGPSKTRFPAATFSQTDQEHVISDEDSEPEMTQPPEMWLDKSVTQVDSDSDAGDEVQTIKIRILKGTDKPPEKEGQGKGEINLFVG